MILGKVQKPSFEVKKKQKKTALCHSDELAIQRHEKVIFVTGL